MERGKRIEEKGKETWIKRDIESDKERKGIGKKREKNKNKSGKTDEKINKSK